MQLGDHPYVIFYLVGCLVTLLLIIAKAIIFSFIGWLTKANILQKNLKKLDPPDTKRWWDRVTAFVFLALFEMVLSWINVPIGLWQIAAGLFRTLRELLTPAPEEIKLLRFPLRNNPDMPREAVFAHVLALSVRAGNVTTGTPENISSALQEIKWNYPSFSDQQAIDTLKSLKVVDSEILTSALAMSRAS
ncbi:TPA: hypothetical protein QDB14_004514 [Burkholderia vietnamiensis]|nr:hypothetical protein [Burkholderia vietnamiensis]